MANEPYITKVYLVSIPWENDGKNTIAFQSLGSQETYFTTKRISGLMFTDFSYQRKNQTMRVPVHIDSLQGRVNYVNYQNSFYSNKWFYAFITDMRYINDNCTELQLETDVIQTWMFDYYVQPSFIEREHTDDDTFGYNTLPENLETGDYVVKRSVDSTIFNDCKPVIALTDSSLLLGSQSVGYTDPIPRGFYYVQVANNYDVTNYIEYIDSLGKGTAIISIFLAPTDLFDNTQIQTPTISWQNSSGTTQTYTFTSYNRVSKPRSTSTIERYDNITQTLTNYTPRNNKLLGFPFRFLQVSNRSGDMINLHFEDFNVPNDSYQQFNINGTLTPSCSYKLIPANYKVLGGSDVDYGLTLGKLPIGAWSNDIYTNWLTQNAVNMNLAKGQEQFKIQTNDTNTLLSVGSALIGAMATGNPVSALSSGSVNVANAFMQNYQNIANSQYAIANINASKYEHSLTPPQANGNLNCGDVNYQYGYSDPIYREMTIKPEYAKIIDDYFDMFGYATNRVKTPNEWHREKWWYTKTQSANITGSIPNDDLLKIKNIYDSGITFWTHEDYIYNYYAPNPIV